MKNLLFKEIVSTIKKLFNSEDFIPLHVPLFLGNEKEYLINCIDSGFVSSVGEYVNKFEEIFLLAPNVKTLPIFTYYTAFTGIIDQGFAASIAVVQFIILSFLIIFYVKKVLKW